MDKVHKVIKIAIRLAVFVMVFVLCLNAEKEKKAADQGESESPNTQELTELGTNEMPLLIA